MSDIRVKRILINIRKRRTALNYSQEYMAFKLGISQKGYSKMELDVCRLTVDRFLEICDILEVEPSNMLSSEEYPASA